MSGFGRDKSRRLDSNGFQGSPMSGFGRENRDAWILMDFQLIRYLCIWISYVVNGQWRWRERRGRWIYARPGRRQVGSYALLVGLVRN